MILIGGIPVSSDITFFCTLPIIWGHFMHRSRNSTNLPRLILTKELTNKKKHRRMWNEWLKIFFSSLATSITTTFVRNIHHGTRSNFPHWWPHWWPHWLPWLHVVWSSISSKHMLQAYQVGMSWWDSQRLCKYKMRKENPWYLLSAFCLQQTRRESRASKPSHQGTFSSML